MLIRLIAICVTATFVFVMAIPVMQLGSVLSTRTAAVAEQTPVETTDFAEDADLAAQLNEIETAAGTEFDPGVDEGFGPGFTNTAPSALADTVEDSSETPVQDIDL